MSSVHIPKAKVADFFVEYVACHGYVVVDDRGTWLAGPSAFRPPMERPRDELQREADQKEKRGNRPCMHCGREFRSEGIHNRMCDPCRRIGSDALGQPNRVSLQSGSGRRRA